MSDPRPPAGPFTLSDLAERLGGELDAPADSADILIHDVAGLADAGPEHLSFVSNRRYAARLATTRAGAVLLDRRTPSRGRAVIRTADPYAAFANALTLFHPPNRPGPRIDPRAAIAPDAVVTGATIEAFAFVGPRARVGPGTWMQAGSYVGEGAAVGRDCRLMPNSVVCAGSVVGDRVWLNPGAVVGAEGFGFAPTAAGNLKIPQVGTAVVEDDVEIGANSCIDRAAMSQTVVRRGAKLDNLVQIGHAAEVGEHSLLVAYSAVAGSSKLGRRVVLAARALVLGHVEVGDGTQVGTTSVVTRGTSAGARVSGIPAIEHGSWLWAATALRKLPELVRKVRNLEDRLARLERSEREE